MESDKHNNFFGEQFLVAPEYRLLRHALLAVAIVLLTFWEMKDVYQEGSRWFPVAKSSAVSLLVVYLNIYVLAPQFLLKRRWYWVYLLAVLYIILLVYVVEIWLNDAVYLKYTPKIRELYGKIEINPSLQVFTSAFSLLILMISSSAVVLFRKWTIHDARVNELEKTVTQVELEQLKKQVNPQFLVRMLDKANAVSIQDSPERLSRVDHSGEDRRADNREEASAILLKLGNILRYQLYDSAREFVLLSSDIQFLTEILTLEQKYRKDFSFTIESEGNIHNYLVPPLLFLPFVEHVVSAHTDVSFIHLHFRVDDNMLVFECRSSDITGENPEAEFDSIDRRLTLLYGNGYSLETQNENNQQVIRLCIPHQSNHHISITA